MMNHDGCIEDGKKVRLHYTVEADGKVVESTEGKPALFYEQGKKHVLPAMQAKLKGLKEGDQIEFSLTPDQAYGERDEKNIEKIPYSELPPRENLQPGMTLQEKQSDGSVKVGRIVKLNEDGALMDFNHPMAGKQLKYKIKVISVISGDAAPDIFPRMKFEPENQKE